MATEKQLDWLKKLAKWKKKELDWAVVEKMGIRQLDELFDSLKKLPNGKVKTEVEKQQPAETEINDQCFGMCAKEVIENNNISWCIAERGKFASDVLSLYRSVEYARKVVKEKLNASPDNRDYFAEMAQGRAEEARGGG